MDFREATDCLFDRVDHERLARELGVSVRKRTSGAPKADCWRPPRPAP